MPTTIISGTTDLEDNSLQLRQTSPVQNTNNFGGSSFLRVGRRGMGGPPLTLERYRVILRVRTGAIPGGLITAVRIVVLESTAGVGSGTGIIDAIKDANFDWVEGTANNAFQAGSSSWNDEQTSVSEWASADNGCGIAGTDRDGVAYGTFSWDDTATVKTFTLTDVQPVKDWKSGARLNSGLIFISDAETTSTTHANWNSTENATTPLTVEIDTTILPSGNQKEFMLFRNPWRLPRFDKQIEPKELVKKG